MDAMNGFPAAAVLGQRVSRMQVQLEHQFVVLSWRNPWRATGHRCRGQLAGRGATQVAVDRAPIDAEEVGHLILRVTGLDCGHDALAKIKTLGAHADRSLP
jgi:hypothetical protein